MFIIYNGTNIVSQNDTVEMVENKINKNILYLQNTVFIFTNDIKNFNETNDFVKLKFNDRNDIFPSNIEKYIYLLITDSTSG